MGKTERRNLWIATAVIVLVVVTDQVIKILVKTNMCLGQTIWITDWFGLRFVENNGFAFGMELGSKFLLTIFRIVMVCVGLWFLIREIRRARKLGFLVCLALIIAGAAGNIFDCLFYGLIFDDPYPPVVAQYVGWGNGYSELLTGKVVDMFYFPLIEWDMPTWMPFYGGEHCVFFSPIFNFADAAISCAVIVLIVFYHETINSCLENEKKKDADK
ncbi:MAG: lipoprotein signal peptidase [Bacteroidaceae bacterium]|nr:lipoprotein signal peptidase [Bacteroidaceae bacterium]